MAHTHLIIGGSRGLGLALAQGVPDAGDTLYTLSRSPASFELASVRHNWIAGDVRDPAASEHITDALHERSLDVCIYNAGIWETGWTQSRFDDIDESEIRDIVNTNLTGLILCVRAALPALRRSTSGGKIVLIGSTCGLENDGTGLVATAASKFGVRGAAHALREVCRPHGITVTCLSPGTIASDDDPAGLPPEDVVAMVRAVIALSPRSCVKEIHMPAMTDERV